MAECMVDGNSLLYRSRYDAGLVVALKAQIPATDRQWDKDAKAWRVAPQHSQTLATLTTQYLGESLTIPVIAAVVVKLETRLLDVRYVGMTKDHGAGEYTAFGWCDRGWNVIFPEKALREWFNNIRRPDEETTLYGMLAVAPTADATELKGAYRRLARQWHPDVCREPDAAEQFKRIQHAYEILSDQRLRGRYDAGLALAATLVTHRQPDTASDPLAAIGYRAPLRCGYILAVGTERLGRFLVAQILAWEDIVNDRGQVLVTSWPVGADRFMEQWL